MMIGITSSTLPIDLDGYAVSQTDSFIDALTTPFGSVIGKRDYGTNLHLLKHRTYNTSWMIDFKRSLKDACKHDPRLIFKSARVQRNEFEVEISGFTLKGSINV